jgi:hypothetical protein
MNHPSPFIRHTAAAASALAFPLVGGRAAQGRQGRHPAPGDRRAGVSGQQCREGALMAIEDINKAGIKSLGGAKLEVLLGDAQSTPQAGTAEVEKMNEAGARPWSAPLPRRSAWPPRRPPPNTTCRTWWTWAWPTRSSARPEEHLPLRPGLRGVRARWR